ncbi:MAG: prepilin-type N-terminal cleavage/methylation domain-containing protein [Candidatus Omnitrophota bacterium]|nr:MAG: prepilin-type N-terminal cleavage/methylation domain-containing protein [Candidatus Omnitrophota bacterium]
MFVKSKTKAFTLIELLIVVAIIGILAAIAVPNFLNAQTRAKIARCKSDLKALSTAQEMYQLDNNRYTYPFRLHPLTSPINYIAGVPSDVFSPYHQAASANSEVGAQFTWYRYVYGTTDANWGGSRDLRTAHCADYYAYFPPFAMRSQAVSLANASDCPTVWLIKSFGPNTGQGGLTGGGNGDDFTLRYDPSNGLVSIGDIAVFGPGGMVD